MSCIYRFFLFDLAIQDDLIDNSILSEYNQTIYGAVNVS